MSRFLLFSFSLCIFLLLDNKVSRVFSLKGCTHKGVNYTECDLMFWTSWSVCDGSKCPTGKQQRLKGVCCPKVGNRTLQETKENCKKDCNLTDADFQEQSPYVPPPTTTAATTIATTTVIVSSTTAKPLTSTKGIYIHVHVALWFIIPHRVSKLWNYIVYVFDPSASQSVLLGFFSSAQLLCSRFTKYD